MAKIVKEKIELIGFLLKVILIPGITKNKRRLGIPLKIVDISQEQLGWSFPHYGFGREASCRDCHALMTKGEEIMEEGASFW